MEYIKKGIDYDETFSPMVKMTTIRSIMATTMKRGCKLFQTDVNNESLHDGLHEEVYMKVPLGVTIPYSNIV